MPGLLPHTTLLYLGLTCFAALVAALAELKLDARQTSSSCTTAVHMIIAPGCHIPCVSHGVGRLSTLISNITAAFPGSDQYLIPYTNSTSQASVSTPFMIQAVNNYTVSCPKTPIVLLGYSLGGIISMNTLCGGIKSNLTANILGVIIYGEETYVAHQSYDTGNCTNNAPNYPRSPSDIAKCAPFAPAMHSYCDSDDSVCCTGGTDSDSHFAYPNRYDVAATNFLKARLRNWTVPGGSSSSSSLKTSSSSLKTSSSSLKTSSSSLKTSSSSLKTSSSVTLSKTTSTSPSASQTSTSTHA